jgi:hypothetical protein
MNRLILGQHQKEIAVEMSVTEARLSVIINSPLFQLELRKKMLRRAEQVLDFEENVLKGANLGARYHKEILESPPGTYPTEVKQKSATVMTTIGAKLIHPSNGGNGGNLEEGGKSYEERLREVTYKETVREVTQKEGSRLDEEEIDEADLLFGDINEEERELPETLESIVAEVEKEAPS